MSDQIKIFVVTDGCFWEKNKREGTEHPHSIEVMDLETGAIRYIRSGSRVAFLSGDITDVRSQAEYNAQGTPDATPSTTGPLQAPDQEVLHPREAHVHKARSRSRARQAKEKHRE